MFLGVFRNLRVMLLQEALDFFRLSLSIRVHLLVDIGETLLGFLLFLLSICKLLFGLINLLLGIGAGLFYFFDLFLSIINLILQIFDLSLRI